MCNASFVDLVESFSNLNRDVKRLSDRQLTLIDSILQTVSFDIFHRDEQVTIGFVNLMKLTSIGYLEGFYYKPRIDKQVLEKYKEGLIVLSSCIKGEVPYMIIHDDYDAARQAAAWYREMFGDDYYLEIQNHGLSEEVKAVKGLTQLSEELDEEL